MAVISMVARGCSFSERWHEAGRFGAPVWRAVPAPMGAISHGIAP